VTGGGGGLPLSGFFVLVGAGLNTNVDVDRIGLSVIVGVNVGVIVSVNLGEYVIEGYGVITVSSQSPGPSFP